MPRRAWLALLVILTTPAAGIAAQHRCDQAPLPDSASADAIFLARLRRAERYTELLRVDTSRATWPMVRLYVRPQYGWKLDLRDFPDDWYPDTLSDFLIAVPPDQDPRLPANSWVLVYMKLGYLDAVISGAGAPPGRWRLQAEGMPNLLLCGLRAVHDTSLGTRLYGPPQWFVRRRGWRFETQEVFITGTVRDSAGSPLSVAAMTIPELTLRVAADSTGRFRVTVRAPPGCYELVARGIGFGPTVRAIRVYRGLTRIDAGDFPLRPAPLPEAAAWVIDQCRPDAASRYGATFGPTRRDSLDEGPGGG